MSKPSPRQVKGPRIVVVGAGVVGLCCALEIARSGGAVTVIDADSASATLKGPPRAASFAAAGMLGAYSEALHENPGHHGGLGNLCAEGLNAWRAFASSDPELTDLVRFDGALLLAHDDADAARVQRAADRAKRHGAQFGLHDGLPPDLDIRLYGAEVKFSVRLPTEGMAPPQPTLARLAEIVVSFGAAILRGRAVVEVLTTNGRVRGVRLDDGGEVSADIVVLATGALAPESLKETIHALARITPAKGMLGVAPAPATFVDVATVRTPRLYLWRDDGALYFGATTEPGRADFEDDPAAIAALFLEARRTLPRARFESAARQFSVGLRPMSPDGAPLVGHDGPEGCIVALGHARNGWLLAPLTGLAVAALCAEGEPPAIWRDFGAGRFA